MINNIRLWRYDLGLVCWNFALDLTWNVLKIYLKFKYILIINKMIAQDYCNFKTMNVWDSAPHFW